MASLAEHQSFARSIAAEKQKTADLARELADLKTAHRIACAVIEEFHLGREFKRALKEGRARATLPEQGAQL